MFFFALASALPALTQQSAPSAPPPKSVNTDLGEVRNLIPGTVKDLALDSAGRILYCTAEREVGRIVPGGGRTLLANAASGPFPNELRALAETASGDIAVLDFDGQVRKLVAAQTPALLVYGDPRNMSSDATDLIVDARGSFLIASATPSSGQRGVNWVSSNGTSWSYYLVKHRPVQLAHDPLTGGIVIAETSSGGNLQLVAAGSAIRATSALDALTHPGISAAADDGDVAAEADGDLYWIAGGAVYRHARVGGATTLVAQGYQQLRGIVIAAASGLRPGDSPWSVYVAEGANPTRLREIAAAGAPGATLALDQGAVPTRGTPVGVNFGFQAFELTADNAGRLLLGGTNFGTPHYVKRVTLNPVPSIATVATTANGLAGVIEGLCVAADDSLYALSRDGTIQHITEGPLTITTVFADPAAQITAGKDLALDLDGALYVACRESWDFGKVLSVTNPNGATLLTTTEETRGLAANPLGGMFLSQWHNTGFHGSVDLLHFADNSLEAQPGFVGMNYTNDFVWGDGDICVDANGSVYTISEDDWSLVRYDPALDGCVRIGSSYVNHPSGLAIAPSTANSGSSTGWSLYIAEFDNLWEKPSVPAPASTLVDSSLGLVGRTLAGAPHPRYGRPSVIVSTPRGVQVWLGTAGGYVLALDPDSGAIEPLFGPENGLSGELVALDPVRGLALNRAGQRFELRAGRARVLAVENEAALTRVPTPQRSLRLARTGQWLVLDGWVVWRTTSDG